MYILVTRQYTEKLWTNLVSSVHIGTTQDYIVTLSIFTLSIPNIDQVRIDKAKVDKSGKFTKWEVEKGEISKLGFYLPRNINLYPHSW